MVDAVNPVRVAYDLAIIPGGFGRHGIWRLEHLIESGVNLKEIIILGGENPVPDKPNAAHREFAPDAWTEFDVMRRAAEVVFKLPLGSGVLTSPTDTQIQNWKVLTHEATADHPAIHIISAPSNDPHRRANTADTYEFLSALMMEKSVSVKDVLISTGSNFRLFQHFDAQRMLGIPHGWNVETIGFDTKKTIYHDPQQYLQEMNSAINSGVNLAAALGK